MRLLKEISCLASGRTSRLCSGYAFCEHSGQTGCLTLQGKNITFISCLITSRFLRATKNLNIILILYINFINYRAFCEENLGTKYVEARTPSLEKSYEESTSTTPMFFILSPGVDPLKVRSFYHLHYSQLFEEYKDVKVRY